MVFILIAVISLLIFITAFYVAAEFSAVSVRRSRLAQSAEGGNVQAEYVLDVVENPRKLDTYIAACQVGITIASLGIGIFGQARILDILAPALARVDAGWRILATSITSVAILLMLTMLTVILGELLPKNVGLLYPVRLAILTAPGMRWSVLMLRPFIWFFNGSGILILRLLGADPAGEHAHVHSPDEIEILVEESSAGGVLDPEERRLLLNTLRLRNVTAQRAMIPRNSMVAGSVDASSEELLELLANSPYSRLPLYEGTIDTIVGAVHLKDLMCAVYANQSADGGDEASPATCIRPVLHVPELAGADDVMRGLQEQHLILAIVVDEYGGTSGMITLEDLIEEIVGEFSDEFDVDAPAVELLSSGWLRVRGDVALDELADLLDVDLESAGVETIGGLVLTAAGHVPESGETVPVLGIPVRVERVTGNRIAAVNLPIPPEQLALLVDRLSHR